MGLIIEGCPLSWKKTEKLSNYVREHGINQFINHYRRWKNRDGDVFKWGDEIEYILVKFDDANKVARVSLNSSKLLRILNQKEEENPNGVKSLWRSEYGAYMIEGSPGKPYGDLMIYMSMVEANMRHRREEVSQLLRTDETMMSLTNFPRLGASNFTWPVCKPQQSNNRSCIKRSLYIPDELIYNNPRYTALHQNIRRRRGEPVDIRLPIFKDTNTVIPVEGAPADEPDAVHMDDMAFGTGCCCLQLTFQACNVNEARELYDQLAPLCPIMLALTAASPVFRGYLVDSDCRWNVLRGSLDCRSAVERGIGPLKQNQFRIEKYRYDSIDAYLTPDGEEYNDIPLVYDEKMYQKLRDGNVDHLLAQHIAHLFARDPLILLTDKIYQNDEMETHHFDNIQTTNYRSMRFKPPAGDSLGWRVEFRPCEVQITDFENAAIACFIALLTRVILEYRLNFRIPISKVDENMQKAQTRDALRSERFWFRKNIVESLENNNEYASIDDEYELMTIDQIINGNGTSFIGIIPLMGQYVLEMNVNADTYYMAQQYLTFIQQRASGELLTTASWIRQVIINHPEYKNDSVVSERINFDLMTKVKDIQEGTCSCPELFGSLNIIPTDSS